MELDEQYKVAGYLIINHPEVEFRFDLAGVKLPVGLAVKSSRLNGGRKGWPDLFVAEPRGKYHGLYIEMKINDRSKVYKKNGELVANKTIRQQAATLDRLAAKGYKINFCFGYENTINYIEKYLSD